MPFATNTNRRVLYATQGVALGDMGATSVKDAWGTSDAAVTNFLGSGNVIVMHGIQSIGVNTNFSLEAIQELGQLSIYENVEEIPDVEVTIERVLDGYTLAYHAATVSATTPTLTGRQNARADLRMIINLDTETAVSSGDVPVSELYCSGMYWSSYSVSLPTEGNFTESLTLVGNNKKWIVGNSGQVLLGAGDVVNSAFTFGTDSPDSPDGGVLRRNNFVTGTTGKIYGGNKFVTLVPTFIAGVSNNGSSTGGVGSGSYVNCGTIDTANVHIQSMSFSVDAGREQINHLGALGPYYRYVSFPVEVSTEIEVIATAGDNVDAIEDIPTGGNLRNHTIQAVLDDSTVIQVGNKNKIKSITYGGGDATGGNATIKYSLSNNNDFTILHSGDPMNLAAASYFVDWPSLG